MRASSAPAHAIRNGHFDKSLVPVYHEDGSLALDREEYPRPQTTLEGPRRPEAGLPGDGRLCRSTTRAPPIATSSWTNIPDLEINFVHHAGNSSGVVDGSAAILLASPEYAKGTA